MTRFLLAALLLFLTGAAVRAQVSLTEEKPIPIWLHAASMGSALADISSTAYAKTLYPPPFFEEDDPLAKPIVDRPNALYVPAAVAVIIGVNLLADRMNRSPRFHRFARPMLLLQSAASTTGAIQTIRGNFLEGLISHKPQVSARRFRRR